MSTQITTATRRILRERSGGVCEVCGAARATEASHRRPRGMGGTSLTHRHGPAWVIDACHDCHQGRIERHRVEALAHGWLLDAGQDAAATPAWLTLIYGTGWWFLLDDGGYSWGPDAPAPVTARTGSR